VAMEERDKMILRCLDRNARMSLTDIGKELKMPVTSVKFRIEKMVEDGVVQQFTALLDPDMLGCRVFSLVTVRTEHFLVDAISRQMVDSISKELSRHPAVQFAAISQEGSIELLCVLKSMGDLDAFVGDVRSRPGVRSASARILEEVVKGKGMRAAF